MIHDDFGGAVPRFYEKFLRALPSGEAAIEQFVAVLDGLADGARVIEIGMGTGVLAHRLLQEFPQIAWYVGIDPSEAMVTAASPDLLVNPRFTAVVQGFETWAVQPESVDAVVCRYVLHDFPDQLECWYKKIAEMLKPGGVFVSLDVTSMDKQLETQACLDVVIRLLESVEVNSPEEQCAKTQFIRHLQGEVHSYRRLEYHLAILSHVGLEPQVISRFGNNYLLRAVKP